MADEDIIGTLLYKQFLGSLTEEERKQLEEWIQRSEQNKLLLEELEDMDILAPRLAEFHPERKKALRERILKKIYNDPRGQVEPVQTKVAVRLMRRWGWAAAAVLFLISGFWLLLNSTGQRQKAVTSQFPSSINDIPPGGNRAVLTLSNGTKIILDSVHNGQLVNQGSSRIVKISTGLLAYKAEGTKAKGQVGYNTLSTPRGGQYQLQLPDGTKVWLNAASSIRYPTRFFGKERVVRITGEAYFEIAANAGQPFKVLVNNMIINVLGTHFNVAAYEDEAAEKITLLEGAVKINVRDKNIMLKPGEQLRLEKKGDVRTIKDVNLQGIVSWTHDQFWFNDADIYTVMRQISRWYNVNVVIKGHIPEHFAGYIPRDVNVSKIFEVLQQTDLVKFSIEKNRIIVSPHP